MEEMTELLAILKLPAISLGSIIITLIISKRLNKRTDDVRTALLEQEFYKNLNDDYKKELKEVKDRLGIIVEQNNKLIEKDEVNSKIIKDQIVNLNKWENYCEELKRAVKDRDKTNGILVKELESFEKKKK